MPETDKKKGGGDKGGPKKTGGSPSVGLEIIVIAFVIIFAALFLSSPSQVKEIIRIQAPDFSVKSWVGHYGDLWAKWVNPVFFVLDVLLLVTLVFALYKIWPLRPRFRAYERPLPKRMKKSRRDKKFITQWNATKQKSLLGTPDQLRLAVIEADALVDHFLKMNQYEGDHMADRLSQIIPSEVHNLENVWSAHRLRNDLVHTPGTSVNPNDARAAIKTFEDFLKELGGL